MTASHGSAGAARQDRREYWRQYHLRNKEKRNANALAHYYRHREKDCARRRAYHHTHPEICTERHKAYRQRNKDQIREYNRKRRAEKRKVRDPIAAARRLNALAIQAAKYGYMGKLNVGRI